MPKLGPYLVPSLPGTVPHGGGSRDNRPDPILLVLPSMAGSEEEFLLLETQSLKTDSRGIQGSERPH